jgi:hypothetical protein
MSIKLEIFESDNNDESSFHRSFRFAVVKCSKSYPLNFVCILPVGLDGNQNNAFTKLFGDKSLEQAKALLIGALKTEDDNAIKAEIERRLKLLIPEENKKQVKCIICGKHFQPKGRRRRYKRNYCEDCARKKFGSQ